MGIKTGVLLLLTVTTACGLSTSLNCTQITHQTTLLQHFQHCKVTIEDGYVNAICNILVGLPLRQKFIPADPETLTMEQHLVSDTPVDRMTPNDGTVCLSLRSVKIKKWDNFPPEMAQQYDMFLTNEDSIFGPFNIYSLLIYIRQMTFQTNFGKPPQVAAAICNGTRNDGSCNFDVYGFVDRYRHKFTSGRYLNIIVTFVKYWNIYSAETDAVNITFSDTVKKIPKELFWDVAITPIRHFLFYKCNFDSIGEGEIPHLRKLDSLEFFQTPIKKVHPLAFDVIPDLRHASLIGTKLPGIPAAIFSLTRLDTLDMSNTDVPRDTEFQYCPGSCEENSSVQRLILSGTNLSSLPDRAFCGFPFLRSLEIDNCHITQLSGSPFICLGNLSNLHMPGNKIKSLDGENVKGLKNLLFLDLNRNRIAQFEGPQIFSNLISLRRLILSQNEIKELQLGTVEYVPIEQLNLVYNRISKWKPPLFARMGNLKTLLLEHNVLSRISDDMLHDISHVSYVNVSWNPWDCSSCQLENLLSLLHKHPMQCKSCLFCKEPDEHEGWLVLEVPWNENDCAPPDHYRIYGIPALLSIMVSSVVAYIVYRNRWYCMYGLLYLKVVIKGYRRHTHAGRFLWDGFLSYHASDAEWVRDVLLPKLESAPMKFRLCVAERDFIPGLPITENICRAITQSRVSLFVISREFCRSRWCMFELSLAQHRLFENDRHDGMVFIRKNDVDESEMSSMLVYLIKSRTYVQLPPVDSSEALSNLFWLQVQAALEQ